MKRLIRIIGISLAAALVFCATAITPVSSEQEQTVYFHRFSSSLRSDYGNAPDTVKYGADGSLTMKSVNSSVQKQCYFRLNTAEAKNALAVATAQGGSGKLEITVKVDECVDEKGIERYAEIKIWLDTTYGDEQGDVIIQEWQAPHSTITYDLDVTAVEPDSIKGFYVCAMNYQVPNGIAPTVTFSPCVVKITKDTGDYFHLFTEALRQGYGNGPEKAVYYDDGAVRMKSRTVTQQQQMYFAVDSTLAKIALERAAAAEGLLYITVRVDSCTDSSGAPSRASINLWIDDGSSNSYRAAQWVDSGGTATLSIDVTSLELSAIRGVYVSAENYSNGGGIACVATYSPIMITPPQLKEYSDIEYQYTENEDGTLTLNTYLGIEPTVEVPSELDGKTVTALGDEIFDFNYDVEHIIIPDSVTKIGSRAFRCCTALERVELGSGITEIGGWAFERCTSLGSITLPESITKIGSGLFYRCTALSSITLPSSLTRIGSSMFYGCTALTQVTAPRSISEIGELAFGETERLAISGFNGSALRDYALLYGYEYTALNDGDANADGEVNAKDLLLLRQHLAAWQVSPDPIKTDANGDGSLDAKDLLYLRQLLADIPVEQQITPLDKKLSELEKLRRVYSLSWADEFNGSALDHSNWSYEGSRTHRNGELQSYCDTDEQKNVYLQDGCMVIEARRESRLGYDYSSGSVHTRGQQQFKYGMIEISARLPRGKGVWPAFWMMGVDPTTGTAMWPQTGELDILEMVGGGIYDRTAYATIHTTDERNSHISSGGSTVLESGTFNDAFHTFGVLWNENEVYWYLDDEVYFIHDITDPNYSCFNQFENYIIINLAIGGSWPGTPADSTEFPAKYFIDYCRVYQAK